MNKEHDKKERLRPLLGASVMILALSGVSAQAANFTVNTTNDTVDVNPGDGVCADVNGGCSLRAAIQESNALSGADGISVPAGAYVITRPGGSDDAAVSGDLDITDDLTLSGQTASRVVVDGNGLDRVFHLLNQCTVIMSGVTITNGASGNEGGGIAVNDAVLTLSDSQVTANQATRGGGIAIAAGGGAVNVNTVSLTLDRVTVNANRASTEGGGVLNLNNANLLNVTVSGNSVDGSGGGIANRGTLVLTNVTITDNHADQDGNGDGSGGGLFNANTASVRNSIVAANQAGVNTQNCFSLGGLASLHSLEDGSDCGFTNVGDRQNSNPAFLPLGDFGGETPTQPIVTGSAALNAAEDAICPPVDQRGEPRSGCDMGAYEAPPPADLAVTKTDVTDPVQEGDNVTYTVIVSNFGPGDAGEVTLSDPVPDTLVFRVATPSQGECAIDDSRTVQCQLGAIARGGRASVNLVFGTSTAGTVTNSASAPPGLEPDPNVTNNSDSETTVVDPAPSTDDVHTLADEGGGGGGALGLWELLALSGAAWLLRGRRRRRY